MRRSAFGSFLTIENRGERIRVFIPPKPPVSSELSFSAEEKKFVSHTLFSLGRLEGTTQFSDFGKKLWDLTKIREFAQSLSLEGIEFSLFEYLRGLGLDPSENPSKADPLSVWMSCFDYSLQAVNGRRTDQANFWRNIEINLEALRGVSEKTNHFLGRGTTGLASVPPPRDQITKGLDELNNHIFANRLQLDPVDSSAILLGLITLMNAYGLMTGPIGRMVSLALLHREGLMNSSVLALSGYIETNSHKFTEALSLLRNNGDWEAWIAAFAEIVSGAADETSVFNRTVSELYVAERERVALLGRPAESIYRILEAVYDTPVFTSNLMVRRTGLTPATVNKSLRHMEELSIVKEVTERRRGRLFEHRELLLLLGRK